MSYCITYYSPTDNCGVLLFFLFYNCEEIFILVFVFHILKFLGLTLQFRIVTMFVIVAAQPEFESKDCHPQMKGVVLRIVADR
jgi:hypothetical protein